MNIESLFLKYKSIKYTLSIEEEQQLFAEYVYKTNKLEGNKLSLAQTTSIIQKGVVSGENITLRDQLEAKGMYKALVRMLKAVLDKEKLTENLIKELNWLIVGPLYKLDEAYATAKLQGQKENEYKQVANKIRIISESHGAQEIIPLSSPEQVEVNMKSLIAQIKNAKQKSITERGAYLVQEIWLHQPFIDGNKRTGRLLVNFLTMSAGYPLFIYDDNYNHLLVQQYLDKKPGIIQEYIEKALSKRMNFIIERHEKAQNNKNLGFRMVL